MSMSRWMVLVKHCSIALCIVEHSDIALVQLCGVELRWRILLEHHRAGATGQHRVGRVDTA